MVEEWSEQIDARVREWCEKVAVLGIDVLVDAGLVASADLKRASTIVAEELFVRLCLRDYPPVPELSVQTPIPEPEAPAE
jgi:hypothetical protein